MASLTNWQLRISVSLYPNIGFIYIDLFTFIHSFIHSFIHPFIHSFIHSFIRLVTQLIGCSLSGMFNHSFCTQVEPWLTGIVTVRTVHIINVFVFLLVNKIISITTLGFPIISAYGRNICARLVNVAVYVPQSFIPAMSCCECCLICTIIIHTCHVL